MLQANYQIVRDESSPERLVIRDMGGPNASVTNAAENVVQELSEHGELTVGRRLFYYDTTGQMDEIVLSDGKFAGFAPGPRK